MNLKIILLRPLVILKNRSIDEIMEKQDFTNEFDNYITDMETKHTKTKNNDNKLCFEKKKDK